ncbi:DNA helicase RecQ [bacterium D16-54]|nr:DNA helicase RecQ [bacterium D16-54]RKJ10808.1 DNA helicase RecQ [bacterium D16-56]
MNQYEILKKYFGYDSFREAQETLIGSILSGKDTVGIMPTGAGKSLCFQIPALMMDGITLVISPLISLMKDQVGSLNQAGIHAAYLNSSLTMNQYYKALEFARQGRYPIIYVAPERLMTEEFLDFALHTRIAMVAVDEAHCVSQWGQDFRPSYLKIVEFIGRLPKRPVVSAFTATATKEVRDDILDILQLREPMVMTTGFDRSNLYFGVMAPKDRYGAIRNYLECHSEDSGIIYCLTRKVVEEVSERLRQDGFGVVRYHAGLSDQERKQSQDDFIYDRASIMVATNAFGMGIDKSNVRFVLHYGMPKNMESYYQEAGRAGRDGEPAECILYYAGQDVITNQFFIDHNQDNQELDEITRALVQERDRERLRKMTFYCFTNECLRDYILRYFGEYGSNYCGNCQNCLTQFETVDVTDIARGIVGCVQSCRQRYGVNVILDTVHGANTAKIRQYQMDKNPYYGELSKIPMYRLRQVMNYLQLKEFLAVTNDEYAIVKLTANSRKVLENTEEIIMRMAKEQERENREKGEKKTKKGQSFGVALTEQEEGLFQKLRALRTEIAREEKVPPYIVFSDKTLIAMSKAVPRDKSQMLSVSGVGEFKYDKYGERFLACILSETRDGDREDSGRPGTIWR